MCPFCYLADDPDAEPVVLDKHFKIVFARMEQADGVVQEGVQKQRGRTTMLMETFKAERTIVKICLHVGRSGGVTHFICSKYAMRRKGCKLFWHASALYKSLGHVKFRWASLLLAAKKSASVSEARGKVWPFAF